MNLPRRSRPEETKLSDAGAGAFPVVDLAFALIGRQIPEDYRYLLWSALRPVVPWMEEEPSSGIVGIRLTQTGSDAALLSRRARLTLRLPRARLGAARRLEGVRIRIGSDEIEIGAARERPLQASPTLYAPLVVLARDDEPGFVEALAEELSALGASCRPILGRRRSLRLASEAVDAYPVALHGCNPALSLQLQAVGLGSRRELGCGVFVPHKKIENIE